MLCGGVEWTVGESGWQSHSGRCLLLVWPFGNIHQAKILVPYTYAASTHIDAGKSVGIGLRASETREQAMKRAVTWVEEYEAHGAPGPDALYRDLFAHYPSLFRTRVDVIAHVFFVGGTGYEWLDGAVVGTLEYDPDVGGHTDRLADECRADINAILDDLPPDRAAEMRALLGDLAGPPPEPLPIGPMPDGGEPCAFHFRRGANVTCVPPDVRDDWLAAAYEAACALRDRSVDQVDRDAGAVLVAELTERFGGRVG